MVFLPGDHVLDINITVTNVAGLIMHGESSLNNLPTVVCNGPVGLSFTSMVDFKVHSLAFTSCSRDFSDPLASKHALLFDLVEYAELVNCSFHGNSGTALVVINTNITLTGNTNFTHNHCEDDYCVGGGGIAAVSSNLTFIGDTMFIENNARFGDSATHGAAGIDIIDCILTSTGSIHFINNTNTGFSVSFVPSGTIWASASSLHFTGTNNFIGNSAITGIAGAIAVTNTSLSFTESSNFNYNSGANGGAIYAECDSVLTFSGTNTFTSNSAVVYGSAIFASDSKSVNFNGTNIFNNNSAPYCGTIAIFSSFQIFCDASDTYTVLDLTGTNNLSSNSAAVAFSGAICMSPNTSLILSGTTCSHLNSNSGAVGGAICALNTTLTLNGTVSFTNNEASNSFEGGGSGGGVYLFHATVSILSNTTVYWENNSAYHGGAIYINDNVGSCIGGGEFPYTSAISTSPDTTLYWETNHARLGGAIYVDDSSNPFIYCTQVEKSTNECFFQFRSQNLSSGIDAQFDFMNNSADVSQQAASDD